MARGKKKLEINAAELQAVIDKLEKEGSFVNPTALWKAVEETEWAKNQKPRSLTFSVVAARVKELGVTYQTQAGRKGRESKPLPCTKEDLQKIVDQVESSGKFSGISKFWDTVSKTKWAMKHGFSAMQLMGFAQKLEIVTKTKSARKAKSSNTGTDFDEMRRHCYTDAMRKLVDKAEAGSKPAGIKLHCLQCACGDKKVIRYCTSGKTCGLHSFRPYQKSEEEDDDEMEIHSIDNLNKQIA